MQLTSLELSKKLVELGCQSQSWFCYISKSKKPVFSKFGLNENTIPAFSLCDFVGQSEVAKENRKKVFDPQDKTLSEGMIKETIYYRLHTMIDHEQGFEDYLWKVLR